MKLDYQSLLDTADTIICSDKDLHNEFTYGGLLSYEGEDYLVLKFQDGKERTFIGIKRKQAKELAAQIVAAL